MSPMGVVVAVGVAVLVGVAVGDVGAQMRMLFSRIGVIVGTTTVELDPLPPQLATSDAITSNSAGAIIRHLFHHIGPKSCRARLRLSSFDKMGLLQALSPAH